MTVVLEARDENKVTKERKSERMQNSRRINLSTVGKILGRIAIDRVRNGMDNKLWKEQAGYSQSSGETEQVSILGNITEQVN